MMLPFSRDWRLSGHAMRLSKPPLGIVYRLGKGRHWI
jgi:hypothetical protein